MKNLEIKKVKVRKVSTKKSAKSSNIKVVLKNVDNKKEEGKKINTNLTRYVLDNSVIGKIALEKFVYEVIQRDDKIIITSLFLKGLEESLREKSLFSDIALDILLKIAQDEEHFEVVKVDEKEMMVDDCILAQCCDTKGKVVLVVGNSLRAAKSRLYEIKYVFLNEEEEFKEAIKSLQNIEKSEPKVKEVNKEYSVNTEKLYTLSFINQVSGELVISEFKTDNQYICLYTKDAIYDCGRRTLKIGDEILVATKKLKYINFCHYRVCNLNETENCLQLFHKKIYNINKLKISSSKQRKFLNDFKCIFDL